MDTAYLDMISQAYLTDSHMFTEMCMHYSIDEHSKDYIQTINTRFGNALHQIMTGLG